MKVAVVRGAFANPYELQNFEGLGKDFRVTVFGSRKAKIKPVNLPFAQLFSPYDLFGRNRFARGIANRILVDSHYLLGLENRLRGYDIAHTAETYYRYTQQCLNVKKKGYVKKVVCTVWENIPFNNEGIPGRKAFKKRAFREIDLFLAVTEQAKQALIAEGCNEKKIKVLMPGIDTGRFVPGKRDGKTVVYVGRNVFEKGIGDLPKSGRDYTVKIISSRPYSAMPQVYKKADIFVLPSRETETWKEQYGMVLLEAMAAGLPIVTTGTGAIREVAGDAAIYSNPQDLGKTLTKLVKDKNERAKRGKMSRERAEKLFDRKIFASKLEKIYEDVLRNS